MVRIVIAGGGTGGHLFPGIAIAEEFISRYPDAAILFIGTKRGIESRLPAMKSYNLVTIDVEGIKGRGIMALIKGAYRIPKSMWQARRAMKKFAPQLVIGVGGYASGPAVMTAYLMGLPTVIAEQNAVPGITNRILGKVAEKIFLTYAASGEWFPRHKVTVSGNPVRSAFTRTRGQMREKADIRHLLIFGGSQGAAAINKAVAGMLSEMGKIKNLVQITHQTGVKDGEAMKQAYQEAGIKAEVTPFIDDMAAAYRTADLIICRAGATSLAEITAAGRAAVLIPFPLATNDHQTKNAEELAHAGAAVIIKESDLTAAVLWNTVSSLLQDEKKLKAMAENSARQGNINAAAVIVDSSLALLRQKKES
ncbi:MAG TPA: undecaprenyldiphospho-muramoylpentapeptide beta-N-acetylglucosaminyltransferase [Smithellaceae bacterium]|nr:undecaprenyldiphospho-muramoylpentapeptide beta-N-acetylglucosaminyltransferase [Smithellaceae bacterium]